ncbi:MAG: hypothetical protein DRN04_08480 [Thermoprotei archaeon]|nr:MAG: hypothetical protein DRN04_08480 [Thermoprotei archaeon]
MQSEVILKVGKKGEIYTSKEVRRKVGIKEGGKVKAIVEKGRLIIEPIPTIEEVIKKHVIELSPEEAEKLSEEIQKEEEIYG